MKNLVLLFAILLLSSISIAQSPLQPGERQLNIGLGIDDGGGTPVYAGVDFLLSPNLSLGPVLGISGEYVSATGNLNYHFDNLLALPTEWNIYAGVNAGFILDTNGDQGNNDKGFGLGAQIGGRYFFSKRVAVNLEGGGGNQLAGGKLGVTIKF